MVMMDVRLLCIVSWITTCSGLTGVDEVINKARCRATCLAKFLKPDKVNSDICEENKNCQTCWETCGLLYENYNVWDEMCIKKCRQGCKVACSFIQTPTLSTIIPGNDSWEFAEKPVVMTKEDLQQALMIWSRPQPRVKLTSESNQFVVYVLMSRDILHRNNTTSNWMETLQTASTYALMELNKLPYAPEFWLLAVNQTGTIAQLMFDSNYWTELSYERHDIPIPPRNEEVSGLEASVEYDTSSTLNVSMDIQVVDGELKPTFMWILPMIPGKIMQDYALHYFLDHCDCDLPPDHYEQSLRFENTDVNKKATFHLKKIAFSAQYRLLLEMEDDKDKWYARIRFYTPKCVEFEALEFSKCRTQASTLIQSSKGDDSNVTTKLDSNDKSFTASIKENTSASGQRKIQNKNEPDDGHHIETTTTEEPEKWKLLLVSKVYQPEENAMIYNVTWSTVFNQSAVKYKLAVYDHKLNKVVDILVENGTYAIIEIPSWLNDTYFIHGVALYNTTSGETREITSKQLVVGVSNEDIHAKVLAVKKNLQAEEISIFNGIILGVSVVASIIILGIIVLFIYKKRQSFRDIIITKTTVAKSNSYKSNVGCKVDYSNQMLIVNDEWELDCSRLKFSSPLGQGAFGKVVTGFYGEKRVAIKLVRDSAPISYKEDLLAEINLMKKLGSHPNIVGMIGACTHMEPIALVMEYVPYGNLQNFLKKCRLEGELTKSGPQTELIYSLMDDDGGIDNGVIRPTDMLSFARQVAMAMEYLAEKKYVHRDLAARNILLGYNKIVKLCDFGLSRDVYNENQYKKLTNGKLPLKWMAIESLTDRVFTTQSDVWSFGILLWEIVTMGASPYPNIALADLYYVLSNGYRMEKPSNCSDELYIIMWQCWMENPRDRPTFTDLRVQLEVLMTRDRNYLELYNINVPLSTPESSSASPVSDDTASLLAAQALQPARKSSKDELTVSVSVHDKSLDRLLKMKGDFDARCGVTVL
ncbi:hypothetical protein CHS0354_027499 [Potamilus streckersoni]|uniref:receptor protein-tyrosine kinase n=1 Tax=Potamilus streckersoni TaxID=2493646 RepID=A0AAE0VNX8_9BIVA|nr:hypothetical protein CHS0354_027499 [Potamilus streckersoni]